MLDEGVAAYIRRKGLWSPATRIAALGAQIAAEPDRMVQAGGYAVSAGGKTQLRLFNAAGDGAFGETLAEVPGTALSVTEYAPDKDSLEIYLLCEADGMRRIHVYDALKKTQRTLPGEFGCSEIVMAK